MQTKQNELSEDLVDLQRNMGQELANCLANECTDTADRADDFAQSQANLSISCRETILVPQFQRLRDHHTKLNNSMQSLQQVLMKQVCPLFFFICKIEI